MAEILDSIFSKIQRAAHDRAISEDQAPDFDWNGRQDSHEGKKVEAGDEIMLAYRMVTTTHYILVFPEDPDVVKSDGFVGWDWKGSERTAKLYPVAGDDLWDEEKALVFTVRKSRRNNITLEAVVD